MSQDTVKKIAHKKSRPTKRNLGRSSWLSAISDIPPFIHAIIIVILLVILFLLFVFSDRGSSDLYRTAKKENVSGKIVSLNYNVFGDHFVNNLAVNSSLTNFYYDNITTAYTFIPEYSWQDMGVCRDRYCGLKAINYHFPIVKDGGEKVEYCITKGCLSLEIDKVFYNNRELELPLELGDKEIKKVTIYPLNSTWLVGFVFQDGNTEKGKAYLFDGQGYMDLDIKNEFPFVSRDNFTGATIGFGGDENNYLVLYGGYDFSGYQVNGGKKYDISRFMGLRVASGGFSPVAIKKEKGSETLWYVCSLDEKNPRLVKLWQNSSDSIKGSLSLTKNILEDKEGADSAWCRASDNSGDLVVVIEKNGKYYQRLLQDNGFTQKQNYRIVTNNLLTEEGEIEKASFSSLLACDDKSCSADVLKNSLAFSVSGDANNYFPAKLDQKIEFPDNLSGLYWQIEAKGKEGNSDYSPWIDGLTAISYSYWK